MLFPPNTQSYGGVPYSSLDFHQPYCEIDDYSDENNVRNCYLVGLNDLDGGKDYVREKVNGYVNDLISLGVKGFRVDAAKHMWPGDLEAMEVKCANSRCRISHKFETLQSQWDDIDGNDPFVYHEVIAGSGEAVTPDEYYHLGKITEFNVGLWLACIRDNDFHCLEGYPDVNYIRTRTLCPEIISPYF